MLIHRGALTLCRLPLRGVPRRWSSGGRRRRFRTFLRCTLYGTGFSALGSSAWIYHCLQNDAREAREKEREIDEQKAHHRQELVRLEGRVPWGRLLALLWIMLPAFLLWPLNFLAPTVYWNFVARRIDSCGPCCVKLAQWLATRRDLLPDVVCQALGSMHQKVIADWAPSRPQPEILAELQAAGVEVRCLESKPVASGSIGEVYFGTLTTGREVAVKTLRPGVRDILDIDLALLLNMSILLNDSKALRFLGIRRAVEEFCEYVQMQTSLQTEASHLRRFRKNYEGLDENIVFPEPIFESPDLLVLSREYGDEVAKGFYAADAISSSPAAAQVTAAVPVRISGDKAQAFLRNIDVRTAVDATQDVAEGVALAIMNVYMKMVFSDGFLHGDLHPGNMMLRPLPEQGATPSAWLPQWLPQWLHQKISGRAKQFELVILDCGLAIPLHPGKVDGLRHLCLSILYGDFYRSGQIIYDMSADNSGCKDPEEFKHRIADVFRDCRKHNWEAGYVQVGEAVMRALDLVREHHVMLDTTLSWVLFAMLSCEGSARQFDFEVDVCQSAISYVLTTKALYDELNPESLNVAWQLATHMACNFLNIDFFSFRSTKIGTALVKMME